MARIISYMKENGGYTIVQTQELGNCLYASVLRRTDIRREFTTMHLRRMLVMAISKHPHFFFEFLKVPLAKHFGYDRISPEELDWQEAAGESTEAYARDQRLPGPFNLATYCEHLLTNGTWGDDLVLTLISCMWQIKITSVDATTLGETRIRHNLPMDKADLVVIFTMGDHFMGTGKWAQHYFSARRPLDPARWRSSAKIIVHNWDQYRLSDKNALGNQLIQLGGGARCYSITQCNYIKLGKGSAVLNSARRW